MLSRFVVTKIQPTFGVEKRFVLAAGAFLLLFCLFESFYLGVGLPQWIDWFRQNDNVVSDFIAAVYLLAEMYLLYLSFLYIFAARWLFKVIGISFFASITFVEYSYERAVGRFTMSFDINAALAVTSEQSSDSLFAYASFLWLVPTLALLIFSIFFKDRKKYVSGKAFLGWFAATSLFYVQLFYVAPLLFGEPLATSSFDAFSQTTVDYLLSKQTEAIHPPKREVIDQVVPGDYKPNNNVVLIFDESTRGDHLSLNGYTRETTTYLNELAKQKLLLNWGIASSASTATLPSFDFITVGATPEILEHTKRSKVNEMPSIFQYAKAMNYTTYMFDGQMKRYWGGIPDDLNYIDHLINISNLDPGRNEDWEKGGKINNPKDENNGLKQWDIDPQMAKIVNAIFSGSTGNFILVYKRGVHFPYEKNYPTNETKWKPIYSFKYQWETPPPEMCDEVINSYDNAIGYGLDRFFKTLATDYSKLPNNTVIFYTSDHGETFGRYGMAGHGGSTPDEATVPMFVLGMNDRTFDTSFKASHANLFTTLLDLMQVPAEARKYQYAQSLLTATGKDSGPRYFNLADGKKVPFD
jgi:Predicted membrane-associated, metal-dependent hydrolase